MRRAAKDVPRHSPAMMFGGAALAADLAERLLPIFDGRPLITSAVVGLPLRAQVANVISLIAAAAVIVIGIVCLARGRSTLGAGVFLGMAALVALQLVSTLILDIESVRWQAAIYLALQGIESATLFAAATVALRDRPETA